MEEILREDFMAQKTRIVNMNQLGSALNQREDPPVKSLYVYHSNPAAVTPDQNQVLKGLAREDLFTVVHERFMTDTARFADVVLPSTSSLRIAIYTGLMEPIASSGQKPLSRRWERANPIGMFSAFWLRPWVLPSLSSGRLLKN